MKKRLLALILGCVFVSLHVIAQEKVITGTVTSAEDKLPLPGASVKVKGTTVGTTTGPNGNYTIKVKPGQVLRFSFIGSSDQEKTVGSENVINVALSTGVNSLNEVVVTAMGITREKKAIGYSAQTIVGDEIAQTQRENFLNALQGRVAGATITPTSGTPGASAQIIIRGATSLDGDNQPLFVVDGLPISNRTFSEYNLVGQGTYNRTNDYGNRAMDINPDEIASVTILKGPEASALYGTDGASGAIVITTKKPKTGAARVNYNNSFRVENVYRFPEVQTVYGPGAAGFFDDELRTYFGSKYPEGLKIYNNLEAFYKTGFTQKHDVSVEGGTEALTLRSSFAFTDQNGTIPNTGFRSYNAKLVGNSKISTKLSMNGSLNFISSQTDKTYKGASSPMISVLSWPIIDDMTNYLNENGGRRTITGSNSAELDNPFWGVAKNPNKDKNNRVMGNVNLNYNPTKWLALSGRAGIDYYAQEGMSAFHSQSYSSNMTGTTYAGGGINTFNANSRLFNSSFVATLKEEFNKFKPVLRLGADLQDNSYKVTAQKGTLFYKDDFFSMNNTDPTTQRVAYTDELKRKVGVFGNAELGYGDFLYLTLTGRLDMSSTLPVKNQNFFYPATSLSFVFSELGGLKESKWLSYGKFRTSWGQSGKDARNAYITKTRLAAQTTTGGGLAVDVTGGNPDLEAEFTTASEAGLEMGFFKNRLSFDFTYWQTISRSQITAPRLSYATGYVLKNINSGKIRNRGFELLVKGTPIKNKDFAWDISANAARQRGYILTLPADQSTFYVSDTWLFDNVRAQYVKGSSLASLSGYDYLRNKNGDLLINPTTGLPIQSTDFTQIGDRAPDLTIGLTNSFTYKNFNLSFLFDIRKGGDIFNATELYLYTRGLSKLTLDRETPRVVKGVLRDGLENTDNPTQNTIAVNPYIQTTYYSVSYNTRDFIEKDINWIRMKDVTLSYNLPKKLFSTNGVFKSANVFLTGTDLLLFTNYKGVDPFVSGLSAAAGGLGGSGFDFGNVGFPRGYSLGLKLGF